MKRLNYIICLAFSAFFVCACNKDPKPEPKPDPKPREMVIGNAVDLGLSVKWADINVGAATEEEYGDFDAWGETEPKSFYDWNTYKHCDGKWNTINKYNNDSYYGKIDDKTVLESSDDAATIWWGSSWRMPTVAEMEELRTQCIWNRKTVNGVVGYEVLSKSNGNSIFLPAAGYFTEDRHAEGGCYYWTSNVQENNTGFAWRLYHNNDGTNTGSNYRVHGIPVRPVFNE